MSDKLKNSTSPTTEEDVFEIIELAIEDLEVLTKAFDLINDVCEELAHPELVLAEPEDKFVIH